MRAPALLPLIAFAAALLVVGACDRGGREANLASPVDAAGLPGPRLAAPSGDRGPADGSLPGALDASAAVSPPTARDASTAVAPPRVEAAGGAGRRAPAPFDELVLRLGYPVASPFANVLYEGNNIVVRGPRRGPTTEADGAETARRWREGAAAVGGVFVLRDSLFSQQDHPTAQRPEALMMPPCWVTAAVAEVLEGRPLRPVVAPPAEDDAAWAALGSTEAVFGSFPPSARLFEAARRPLAGLAGGPRAEVANARASLCSLAEDAAAMVAAAPGGAEAVARAGAERIAASDRRYFGAELRRTRVIPIFVENPSRHELEDEGKGLEIAGRTVPPRALDLALRAVYGRRLQDGDMALERYDISRPEERRRALRILEVLLPRGRSRPGGTLWVWVNGGLDERGIGGRDATAWVEAFRAEIEAGDVETSRVRLLSKPHVTISPGEGGRAALEAVLARYRALGLPLSVNFDGRGLARLLEGAAPTRRQ